METLNYSPLITRAEAQAQALTHYFTGQPCKRGHTAERLTKNWTCCECGKESDRKRAGTSARLASRRRSYYANQEANNMRDRARGSLPHRREEAARWKEENRERHNAASVAYTLKRVKVDPEYRLLLNLRRRVAKAVIAKGAYKAGRTYKLVGCNSAFLKDWLESQFTDGMSWDNYGQWHVDHIRPCASFDLTDEAQQRQCFHYTNLQPLWAADNRAKSDRLDWIKK